MKEWGFSTYKRLITIKVNCKCAIKITKTSSLKLKRTSNEIMAGDDRKGFIIVDIVS